MSDANISKFNEGHQHTLDGTRPRDPFRARTERKETPAFIAKPLRDAGLLQEDYDLRKGDDGKLHLYDKNPVPDRNQAIDPKSLKETLPSVQYEQVKYDMMKHALAEELSDQIKVDPKFIKEVQKVEDGYAFKYDLGDGQGLKENKLLLSDKDTKKAVAAFEKQMADYGFPIEKPMPESIKKAVLKNAADTAATPEEKKLIENGAVQSYDSQSEKWYISKNGKIEEFSLDNPKIEEDAELNGVKKYLKVKNEKGIEEDIVEAKFVKGQKDQYEVKGANSDNWETVAKEDVDPAIMQKITGEKMINPDSHVTVIESKETDEEAKLKEIDKLIDNLKGERDMLEKWGKTSQKAFEVLGFFNQAAAQASQNLNLIEEALHLESGNSMNQPTTIQSSERVFKSIDERNKHQVKMINKQIEHLDKLKEKAEDAKKEKEKYKQDFSSLQNWKRKQEDD